MNIIKFIYSYIVQTVETLGIQIQIAICSLFVIQILIIRAVIREIQHSLYKRKQSKDRSKQSLEGELQNVLERKSHKIPRLPKNPKISIQIDITGRKNIDDRDVLENYIIDEGLIGLLNIQIG